MVDFTAINVPEGEPSVTVAPLHFQHLVKVAVENFAAPAHVNRVAAHQTFHGRNVEVLDQELHVFVELVIVLQPGREARDGKVRDCVEIVERP